MAGEFKNDLKEIAEVAPEEKKKKNHHQNEKGVLSRIWNGLFGVHGDDFEKRLQHISKEEATVLARLKRRSLSWRRMTRNLIVFSVLFEVVAVVYAIITTRSLDLNWKMRALRVLPMFLLPAVSSLTYSAFVSITRMCDRKDQETIERLRAERLEKINELKERTNYYTTQQLIQRYDPDPAAKAAAATILASKLGTDSGLKLYMGNDFNPSTGKSTDAEHVQSTGLRNRKQPLTRPGSPLSPGMRQLEEEMMQHAAAEGSDMFGHDELVVQHENPTGSHVQDGGWIARIAALLVGEDPTQSYALICGNCHMHNGLARREDFPYITYYCPHCNALNRPKQLEGNSPSSSQVNSPVSGSFRQVGNSLVHNLSGPMSGKASDSSSPVAAAVEQKETRDLSRPGSGKASDSSSPVATAVQQKETKDVSRPVSGKASDSSSPVAAAVEHKETQDVSTAVSDKTPDSSCPVPATVEHKEMQDVSRPTSDNGSDSNSPVAAAVEHIEKSETSSSPVAAAVEHKETSETSSSPVAAAVEHKEKSETTAHESEAS